MASDRQLSSIPALGVLQFDSGSVGSGVNLFRGNLAFPLKLLTLPSRGGLAFDLTLMYQSNVAEQVDQWNLTHPSGELGVGWSMPLDQIVAAPKGTGSTLDADYYLVNQGQTLRLVAISQAWSRGTLAGAALADLQLGPVSATLARALEVHGWRPSSTARLTPTQQAGEWRLDDPTHRRSQLIRTQPDGTASVLAAGQAFETVPYQFWQITFYPQWNSWEVVRPDGSICIFGESDRRLRGITERHLVQWGIKWGHWIGPSTRAEEQTRYATAWNLAEMRNTLGNWIAFAYRTSEQPVGNGSLTYTRECQIAQMQNDLGWSCRFNWADMVYDTSALDAPKEYLAAHGDPMQQPGSAPNAWQDRFTSVYLDAVDVYNDAGTPQVRLNFQWYELTNLTTLDPTNPLAHGARYKRYLKCVTDVFPGGAMRPGIAFSYDFDQHSTANRGALTAITLPTGGIVRYQYAEIDVGADGNEDPGARNLTVPNPFGADKPGAPRVWYGPDYVVMTWYDDSQNALLANVYTWVGRWTPAWREWQRFDGALDIDRLAATTSENSFVLLMTALDDSSSSVYLASRRSIAVADWRFETDGSTPQPHRYDTGQLRVVNGSDFYIVLDNDNRRIDRYALNWHTRGWDIAPACDGGSSCCPTGAVNSTSYAAATGSYYVLFCYDRDNAVGRFSTYVRDALLNWQAGGTLDTTEIVIPAVGATSYFQLSCGPSYAAAAWIDQYTASNGSITAFNYRVAVLSWLEDHSKLALAPLPAVFDGPGFTNLSVAFMQTLGPALVGNALIGSGPNLFYFDGVDWNYHFAGIQYPPGADPRTQYYWYAWDEQGVLKTENTTSAVYSALDSYDPSAPSAGWSTQVLQDSDPPPPERATLGFPTLAGPYLSQGNTLYARSVWPSWVPLATHTLGTINAARFDSTTMINQAPDFLAYMTLDDDGLPQDTEVMFFSSGGLLRDAAGKPRVEKFQGQQMFRLLNRTLRYEAAVSGKLPAIPSGFVTFPANVEIDAASQITLHRYANHSVRAPLRAFVITAMLQDSGYETLARSYAYAEISAATDNSGSVLQFASVSEYQGTADPQTQQYGWTTSHFYNGLPGHVVSKSAAIQPVAAGSCNCSTHAVDDAYTLAAGLLRAKEVFAADGHMVSAQVSRWQYVDQVSVAANGTATRNLYGGVPQIAESKETLQGVARTLSYTYNAASGSPAVAQTAYYDSTGRLNVTRRSSLFAFEAYPALWSCHVLVPVVLASTHGQVEGNWAVQSLKAQTFKQWQHTDGSIYWAEAETWVATAADAPPFVWWSGETPAAGWLLTESIVQRGPQGEVLLSSDITGRPLAALFDDAARFQIASFVNSGTGNAYDSFEDYQQPTWSLPTGAVVFDGDAATGQRCLQVSRSCTLTRSVALEDGAALQLFGLSFKSPAGATAADCKVTLVVAAPNGRTVSHLLPATDGDWEALQWTVDTTPLATSGPCTVQLSIIVQLAGTAAPWVRIDDLFFMPLAAQFQAVVYDAARLRTVATVAPNGDQSTTVYNAFSEPGATIGPWNNPSLISMSYFAAQDHAISPTQPFPALTPNAALNVKGDGTGFYDAFKDDSLARYSAASGNLTDWSSSHGCMSYHGSTSQPLGARLARTGFTAQSMALRVMVDPASLGVVVIGTGQWFVTRTPGIGWQLWRLDGQTPTLLASATAMLSAREWLLVAIDGRLLFFGDGCKIFELAEAAIAAPFGAQIGMSAPGTFRGLVVAEDIGLSIDYRDGLSRSVQTLALESASSAILDMGLYDDRGNVAIKASSSRVSVGAGQQLFGYLPGMITNGGPGGSLWSGAPLEGLLASLYHPDAQGYPFTRTLFENTPLARTVGYGQPGFDFAVRPGNSHYATRTYTVNTDPGPFVYALPVGEYHLVVDVDANGATTQTWTDTAENLIGRAVQSAADDPALNWRMSQVYDVAGRTIASIPPNAYVSTLVRGQIPAASSTATYDFAGRRLSTTDPDSGLSEVVYDSAGRARFLSNGNALAQGYICYRKYDSQSRIVEEGTYPQVWDRSVLQQRAEDPEWPVAAMSWGIRNRYDGDGSVTTQGDCLAGRLWQVEINQGSEGRAQLTERFAYDCSGRIVSRTRAVAADARLSCTVANEWAPGGNLLSSTDSVTGLQSLLAYDPLGRTTTVSARSGNETTPLVTHTYSPGGKPATTTLLPSGSGGLLTRSLDYELPGWPKSLTAGSLLTESLTYTRGACDGHGYYNGEVASQALTSDVPGMSTGVDCTTFDALGRLTAFGSASRAQSWHMDLNGNFLSHTRTSGTASFSYVAGTNRLDRYQAGSDSTELVYDQAGGVISARNNGAPAWQMAYDPTTSRPVHYAAVDGSTLDILRDAQGNRALLTRTPAGSAALQRLQMPIPGGELVLEIQQDQLTVTRFIAAQDVQVAWSNSAFYFGLLDHLGSVRVVVDTQGKVIGAWQYDVYGAPTVVVPCPISWPRLYTGHNYDAESGLYDCNARFYAPLLGRYLSVDPVLETPSPYVFVGNNPLVFTDPSGMNVWGMIAGAVITLAIGVAGVLLLGTGIGAAILVGVVAGAVGAMAGDLMSMATGDQISWKQFAIDALAGAASGAAGALAGGAAGSLTARAALALGAGKAATTISISFVSGVSGGIAGAAAGAGVNAYATGQPFFSRANMLNIVIGAVVGGGAGLMAAGAHLTFFTGRKSIGVNPTELEDHTQIPSFPDPVKNPTFHREFGQGGLRGKVRILMPNDPVTTSMKNRWAKLGAAGKRDFETRLTQVNGKDVDVVATHGIARSAMVEWTGSNNVAINRPISAQTLAAFLRQEGYGARPIKLVTCFAGMPGRFSLAQALANEMQVKVYAYWWTVKPNPNVATAWIKFKPQ